MDAPYSDKSLDFGIAQLHFQLGAAHKGVQGKWNKKGEFVTDDKVIDRIWQYNSLGETSTVTVHVNRIRDKFKELDSNLDLIHTVWGRGYRFVLATV